MVAFLYILLLSRGSLFWWAACGLVLPSLPPFPSLVSPPAHNLSLCCLALLALPSLTFCFPFPFAYIFLRAPSRPYQQWSVLCPSSYSLLSSFFLIDLPQLFHSLYFYFYVALLVFLSSSPSFAGPVCACLAVHPPFFVRFFSSGGFAAWSSFSPFHSQCLPDIW